MKKEHIMRMKKRLGIDTYALVGIVLLLPFLFLFTVDQATVLLTGNRNALQFLYSSFLYTPPVLMTLLLVFPSLAIVFNLFSLVKKIQRNKISVFSPGFLKTNAVAIGIVFVGCGAILLLFGHDVIPCIVNRTLYYGAGHFFNIVDYCRLYA